MANILDPKPELLVKEIDDTFIKRNFINLKEFFEQQNQLLDFKFFTVRFEKAEKNVKVAHGISRTPKDIIFTSMSGNQQIDFNLGLFDAQNMDITVSGPCTISFFAGTYWKDTQRSLDTADILSFGSASSSSSSTPGSSGSSGIIEAFAGNTNKIPKGYLLCDGASYSVKDYPDLAEALKDGDKFAWGGSGFQFNVPDLRGQFLRGLGLGVESDPDLGTRFAKNNGNSGAAVGSFQEDTDQRVTGNVGDFGVKIGAGLTSTGPFRDKNSTTSFFGGSGNGNSGSDFDNARVIRTSSESRPKNAAVNWIIKT